MATRLRLVDLLSGLSMVADLGFGLPRGTAVRTGLIATALARRLGGGPDVRDVLYTALLMHVGCVAVAHESAAAVGDDIALNRALSRTNLGDPGDIETTLVPMLTKDMPVDVAERARAFVFSDGAPDWVQRTDTGVCEVARDVAARLGLPASIQQSLYHAFEAWEGGAAPSGLRGESIPIAARVARVGLEAAVLGQVGGLPAAVAGVEARSGRILDPRVCAVFVEAAETLVDEAELGDPHERLLEIEPAPHVEVAAPDLVGVARVFGDLADLKVPCMHGHAQGVARLAVAAAHHLAVDDDEIERLEVAALLHDVGRVSVSNAIWEKPGPLTGAEWEQVRLHAYHSERILAATPLLASCATLAGTHHERLDGSGYHRCSSGAALPRSARVLAAADVATALLNERPHREALDAEAAAAVLADEVRAQRLDRDAVQAVLREIGHPGLDGRAAHPAGLSDREIEVLALIARGHTNAEVAGQLFISRRTAEHHAQHIYAKIGVSTRAGAALFAVQHGLVQVNG
ncbi:HD domain-containing phosphohydrolase [Aquihabitans daechungensis]|uniref:HD domain-containing phosphohydrolase n=1 Tax=Aquihabitans daechungensis TaxID=1052257 RepID=UPI003BA162B1